ncbi:protein RNA-directed DNA methylation 3-like isoform X1 [Zingiber officinale]|uniref:protein RNA-directed DNA methylation 3-like isoform X1 n=1 Tax=Zingiber officinale TaxID=94328 RepID=UPI001C4C0313|nr:protein RNA-directed DNA methylation 3-like isoform X1 [Zingiber officinale]XP_042439538.1 protein RNA-directed DNA methylation 3-like isoform X1 [Zingiber officinale]
MAASTTSFAVPSFHLRICTVCPWPPPRLPSPPSRYQTGRGAAGRLRRCCFQPEKAEWRFDPKRNAVGGARRSRTEAFPSLFFSPSRFKKLSKQDFSSHCCPKNSPPESRDTPPQRDTGIASEKEWGINLLDEKVSESGQNEYGSTWYRDSGEELGENGFRCHWAKMGGKSPDGKSVWQEMWWEKSDWTGYKELGAEKSGENDKGDSWWETWKEILYQDEWSNLARIERSAQKQAKSGIDDAGWYEKWWEKYDAKGWTEKGAHKYGRLNEQSWWEKWGEHYDGRGFVLKWTDKWAETQMGTRWGDKWGDKFFEGIGSRQGETWHVSPAGERWSRTWGEEHFGNGKVHKYGKSTAGESWDIIVDEETYYEAMPHYGWAEVVGDSTQLLSIQPRQKHPSVHPNVEFDASEEDTPPDETGDSD